MFSVSLAFTGTFLLRLPVRTAVTCHAVLEVLNAFFDVLATHVGWRVLMATVASVFAVVVRSMACRTGSVVVLVENKELDVLESGRLPCLGRVTLPAVACNLPMQGVGRYLVTRLAST